MWRQLCDLAVADARDRSRWEDAFDIAVYAEDLAVATEIVVGAAPEFLAAGRLETLERWLEECGAAAARDPGALLTRAEILVRHGELGQASELAESVARSLRSGDKRLSRANQIAGQALYLRSRSDLAAPFYIKALADAQREVDRKNALWGAFLAHADLDIDSSMAFLAELDSDAAEDLNTRLRVTVARQTISLEQGSLSGLWAAARALVPLARHATDPLVRSNFLAQSAYLATARSDYSAALDLSDEALKLSMVLQHDFATGCCLAYRAAAKVGLRQLASAGSDIALLVQTTAHREDPYLQTQRALTEARLLIARQDLASARAKLEQLPHGEPSPSTLGERIALLALVLASQGKRREALGCAEEARAITSATEAHFFCAFAELIASFDSGDGCARTCGLVSKAFSADYTDSFVVAYRAFPQLLKAVARDPETVHLVSDVMKNASDTKLAQRVGMKLATNFSEPGDPVLTPREAEVLELLGLGLSNAEIAQRLFIAPSTVKVHVRHVLEKLGVKNRVQAALMAKRAR